MAQATTADGDSDQVTVTDYADIERETDLSQRAVDNAVRALQQGEEAVLVLEGWLCDRKDLRAMKDERRVFAVKVLHETEDAWQLATGEHTDWIPKSQATLFQKD